MEEAGVIENITVTGYHIKRIGIEGPAPVVVFSHEDFEQAGINTVEEFTRLLTINTSYPIGVAPIGAAAFDLRGIGVDATLVLVNGLRIAPYGQAAENIIDVNSIPVSAIDRIEILKDGASAIYGADAVAGVVNIILRTNYDGIEVNAGYGVSERGDGELKDADLIAGWDGLRGSVMFSLSWSDRGTQKYRGRDWSSDPDYTAIGGPNYRDVHSSPPTFFRNDTFSWVHDPACGADPDLTSVGVSPWGPDWGTACRLNWAHFVDLDRGFERLSASLSGRYEINPKLSLFGDLIYNDVEGEQDDGSDFVSHSPHISTGRPFVPADHPGNPFGTDGELLSSLLDAEHRRYINSSTAWRAVIGLEGLWGGWDWRLSGLVSENDVEKDFLNEVYADRYQLALLGMGGPDGNSWYDPFGFEPRNDPAVIDWLLADTARRDSTSERSIDLLLSRTIGVLTGLPIGVAAGLQYREQELDQRVDDNFFLLDIWWEQDPVSADRDIGAAYVEFNLPMFDSLEAQLALRYEEYSDFGSTTNPKIALRWQPLASLMLRGSWATSFKPPSFLELYTPLNSWWGRYRDTVRCDITGLPQDCWENDYPAEGDGNPDLDPEEGESWFLGMIWEPPSLPGFEFQLDFWKFNHQDRVQWLSGQYVLDERGEFGIVREPAEPDGTPGRIILVQETYVNIDTLTTRGFDTSLRYRWTAKSAGNFRAGLMHTHIDRWELTDTIDDQLLNWNVAGDKYQVPIPRNRANLNLSWDRGAHAAAANVHYVGHYNNDENLWIDGLPTDQRMEIPSHTTLDLQYSYTLENLRKAELRIGCNNVTDKDPPFRYWPSNEPVHDGRGRFWYVRWRQPIL
jgi:outer membrane receptor protein involved in Fe transport